MRVRWRLAAKLATVSGTLRFFIQDVDGPELVALFMFLRSARASAQYVTNNGEQIPPWRSHGRTFGTTFGVRLMLGSVWWNRSARKGKAHTTLKAGHTGLITADDRTGNDLPDAACKLVVLTYRAPPFTGQLGRHLHNSVDCASWLSTAALGHRWAL